MECVHCMAFREVDQTVSESIIASDPSYIFDEQRFRRRK